MAEIFESDPIVVIGAGEAGIRADQQVLIIGAGLIGLEHAAIITMADAQIIIGKQISLALLKSTENQAPNSKIGQIG